MVGPGDKMVKDADQRAQAGEDEINVSRTVVPAQLPQVGGTLGSGTGTHLTREPLKTLRLVRDPSQPQSKNRESVGGTEGMRTGENMD